MIIFWIVIFIVSLVLLVKSADWLVESSEKIGLALKLSPFIIGVLLVAIGTSFPEIVVTLIATLKGNTEFVVDTAVGSNIATILLIVGISAVAARKLIVKRSLIDLDAPLLVASTVMIVFIVWDKKVVLWEGILLILGFIIYLLYTIFQRRGEYEETSEITEVLPSRAERREIMAEKEVAKDIFCSIKYRSCASMVVLMMGLVKCLTILIFGIPVARRMKIIIPAKTENPGFLKPAII